MTIVEAIREVMKNEGRPMTVSEVYEAIVRGNLYDFKSDNPVHIVRTQIRRHCRALDFPSSSSTKYFEMRQDGTYYLLPNPVKSASEVAIESNLLGDLRDLHSRYLAEFRRRILEQIKTLAPDQFEQFCRRLLVAYGFQNVAVTRKTKDGGIDGHGRLKVGFAYFNVAFQCKRWTRAKVGRPEIDQFRGAIQGQYEQGIFFTTASFSSDAENSSFKPGTVPVILINGATIVEIMMEKEFGMEKDNLAIYSSALDLAISDES
jgi:restriction system protein